MKKRFILMMSVLSLCVTVSGCSKNNTSSFNNTTNAFIEDSEEENIGSIDTYIKLGSNISVDGNGASIDNNKVTITSSGTYSVSGSIDDGQIIIDASIQDNVSLLLDGVNIKSSSSAPIYVKNADKTIIALADGSENIITDSDNYILEDETSDEPNAAIFSKDDLTIIGTGSLEVNANYNNGITSKDDLTIKNGNISVNSVSDGLRGKDSITISGGNITITAEEDGMKSTNIEEDEKGYILIDGGNINVSAGEDGIQADNKVIINDGKVKISSGGGSVNSSSSDKRNWGNWSNSPKSNTQVAEIEGSTPSAKGIKGTNNITINGGNIDIDSSDDSIHSNDSIIINDGKITASSGDDGIHADTSIEVNDGDINITKSYEGIESETITINGSYINLVASDDGFNAAGGNDGSSVNGRPGQNEFFSTGTGSIDINGGTIVIDSSGDGIDANGSIKMTDGTVIVNGPTNNGNGALDYDSSFNISGGLLIAAGSAGMIQAPSQSSSQNTINLTLESKDSNTLVNIKSSTGDEIITFAPSKSYQSLIISSPSLKSNSSYIISTGGQSSGTNSNGIYTDGEYSGGSEVANFTISTTITSVVQEGVNISGIGNPGGGKGPMGTNPNM